MTRHSMYEFKVRRTKLEFKFNSILVNGPDAAGAFLCAITEGLDREHFYVIYLNVRGYIIGYECIAIGSLAEVDVHPREVFRGAILVGAYGIVVGHNHPSGCIDPSPADKLLTERIHAAGELLGIELYDSVVVADGKWRSMIECLKFTSS